MNGAEKELGLLIMIRVDLYQPIIRLQQKKMYAIKIVIKCKKYKYNTKIGYVNYLI